MDNSNTCKIIIVYLDVCDIRLDFETFTLLGPVNTEEDTTANAACQDSFVFSSVSKISGWCNDYK